MTILAAILLVLAPLAARGHPAGPATAEILPVSANAAALACKGGAPCDVDCAGASCALKCERGARCLLRCEPSAACDVACEGTLVACEEGVLACDRDCP